VNVIVPALASGTARISGNRDFKSEELIAYEVGYRIQPHKRLFIDTTAFYNVYDQLRSAETGRPIPGSPIIIPLSYRNLGTGESYGIEVAPTWQVIDGWKLSAGYTFLRVQLHRRSGSTDSTSEFAEDDSPQHQFNIRSQLDLPHHLEFDTALYYVDPVPNEKAPGYVRLDLRLGWSPTPNLDVSVAFQNLLDPHHQEFGSTSPLVAATEIERSIYGKLTWRF
jgi:iron complex outermembrane receptor protein